MLGIFMNMDPAGIGAANADPGSRTPALAFIGAVGARRWRSRCRGGGLLVSVLVLPLAIPVLIFGVAASYAAQAIRSPSCHLSLFLRAQPPPPPPPPLFFAVIGPFAANLALKANAD